MNLSPLAAAPPSTPALGEHGPAAGEAMYLLFQVRGALFGIEAAVTRAVHLLPEMAPIPQAAAWMPGVLDLRGEFVPVLDLAQRLGHLRREPRPSDCLIVLEPLEAPGHLGPRVALLVDEVLHVASIAIRQQQEVPSGGNPSTRFIRAIAHVEERAVLLLHLERLLQGDEDEHSSLQPPPDALDALDALGEVDGGGVFAPRASDLDRALFAERALRLRQVAPTEEGAGRSPFAVIELGDERFGIGLEGVREFCTLRHATPVPCCPPHIVGQMNLRGDILTLLDIRHLLHLPPSHARHAGEEPVSESQQVVVIESGGLLSGVLVDAVLDVLYLRSVAISAPGAASGVSGKFFGGGVLYREQMLCLLDLSRILSEGGLVVDEMV